MALGEVYHHYVPRRGYLFDAAEAAFDSALIYDPGFAAPLFHAIQFAVWDGDRTRADSLWRRYSAIVGGTGGQHDQLALMLGCLDGSSTRERWTQAAGQSEATTVQALTWLAVGGLRLPDCVRAGLDVVVAREPADWTWHYYATVELAFVHAALGNVGEVRRLLGELGRSADIVTIFLATSGLPIADLADSALEQLRQIPDSATTPRRLWAAGTWLIERGDTGSAIALLGRLARFEAGTDARSARLLRASLLARLTLQRGDTTAAIAALRRLSPTGDQATLRWSPWEVLPWERFHLAQLLAARGSQREAAEVASEFDSPASFGYLPWLPANLRLREAVERRVGDAPYANELHRRYLSLTKRDSSDIH